MVMAGNLFVACTDSPAEVWSENGDFAYKYYYGSASKYNGNSKNIEGELIQVPYNNMTYQELLRQIMGDLQSSISYAGGKDLSAFKNVQYYYK